jgi:hypothetical protein
MLFHLLRDGELLLELMIEMISLECDDRFWDLDGNTNYTIGQV